jgi:Anp1
MTANEYSDWHGLQSPIIFNHHEPIEVNTSSISHVDLDKIHSTRKAVANSERVLILTPLRDASPYLMKYFELLAQLSYPHDLIDVAFLVGDTYDTTMSDLVAELERLQKRSDNIPFHSVTIVEKNFGSSTSQEVEDRHGFAAQGPRRKAIGRARNYLLYSALKPEHSWVYWRDVDIVDSPRPIIEDMIAHDTDVIVPNIWFHRYDSSGRDVEGRCKLTRLKFRIRTDTLS